MWSISSSMVSPYHALCQNSIEHGRYIPRELSVLSDVVMHGRVPGPVSTLVRCSITSIKWVYNTSAQREDVSETPTSYPESRTRCLTKFLKSDLGDWVGPGLCKFQRFRVNFHFIAMFFPTVFMENVVQTRSRSGSMCGVPHTLSDAGRTSRQVSYKVDQVYQMNQVLKTSLYIVTKK